MKRALAWGILGSFFFAFTFVLNRSMNLSGGHWLWSASLRYLFTLPLLFALLLRGRKYRPVLEDIRRRPRSSIPPMMRAAEEIPRPLRSSIFRALRRPAN